jgi:DNA-binding response OmpR family regulator
MMGEMSGFRMAKILQDNPATTSIPVIFLTAKDSENDRITGFSIGADDYISKPFSIREVLARVKAVLRRVAEANPLPEIQKSQVISYDQLELILDKKKVLLNGEALSFTKKEFEMLKLFLENRNRVFTRDEILGRIWSDEVVVLDRTIDVNITRLRKKIGQYGKNIVTRLGYGYCFED